MSFRTLFVLAGCWVVNGIALTAATLPIGHEFADQTQMTVHYVALGATIIGCLVMGGLLIFGEKLK